MRLIACLALLLALASPAFADDKEDSPVAAASPSAAAQDTPAPPHGVAGPRADAAPDNAAPGDAAKPHASHRHAKWEDKFAKADTAHNGHLTLQEAESGYPTVAKHFQDIDAGGKGYVTVNDIRAWHALKKAAHAHPRKSDDGLRPQHAFLQRPAGGLHPLNTSATQIVQPPAASRTAVQNEVQR